MFEGIFEQIEVLMGDEFSILKIKNIRYEEGYFWTLFKSDRGMLVDHNEMSKVIDEEKTATLPPFPIDRGQPNGWIEEYLNYLSFLILKLLGSV